MENRLTVIFTEKLTFLKCFGQPLLKSPYPAGKQLILYLLLHYYIWKCPETVERTNKNFLITTVIAILF